MRILAGPLRWKSAVTAVDSFIALAFWVEPGWITLHWVRRG
ncbi:MAG TPA: hypothetical protein VHX43_01335 [Xanthobacteraceae bacterium]|jgi:hypothetical protein|nr:hypothetical protein [Xanthobacteraceae bacterium]